MSLTPQLTEAGKKLLTGTLSGSCIKFTKIKIGNGTMMNDQASPISFTELINPKVTIPINYYVKGSNYVSLSGVFDNSGITTGFNWTETGVFAEDSDGNEVLYAYCHSGELDDYIPPNTSGKTMAITITVMVIVGDTDNVTALVGEGAIYATKESLEEHKKDNKNPHGVTAEQVGLGNVENVAPTDIQIEYDIAEKLEEPLSGETMGVFLGKAKKAINNLILHLKAENPHAITPEKINAIGKKGAGENAEIFNDYAHNTAAGNYAHAQNYTSVASGNYSHAGGYYGWAKGIASFAHGWQTSANDYQAVFGRYNTTADGPTGLADTTGSIFIVGSGTSLYRANSLRISAGGVCYGSQAFAASGADYAEYFEWLDGNPNNDDRRGLFVTIDGERIRLANANDNYVLGVVSAIPVVCGDVQSEAWKDMYLKDVFGNRITEIVNVSESVDEETGQTIPAHTETRFIINPEYDPEKEYTSRENRKEWAAIGLVGKLIVIDDGTCQPNGYCKVADNGMATVSSENTDYRVLSRLDDNHIKILLK